MVLSKYTRCHSVIIAATSVAAIILFILCYRYLDPVEMGRWFPGCPVHRLFDIQCPGCGNQRALHALLNGDFALALRYNYFNLFCLAFFTAMGIEKLLSARRKKGACLLLGKPGAYIYISFYLSWFILRNVVNL